MHVSRGDQIYVQLLLGVGGLEILFRHCIFTAFKVCFACEIVKHIDVSFSPLKKIIQ